MRIFANLYEAISEIERDLAKAPRFLSTRVQNLPEERFVREAMNYSYTVPGDSIPESPAELLQIAVRYFPRYRDPEFRSGIEKWIVLEAEERLRGYPSAETPDFLHPELQSLVEGNEFSYAYSERLIGMIPVLTQTLLKNPDTRRAYWPVYQPLDAVRAQRYTRIPCSLGYHVALREVPDLGPHLHLTYISRSCDFQTFWITDLWMASQVQRRVLRSLKESGYPASLGQLTHFIISFHAFEQEDIF